MVLVGVIMGSESDLPTMQAAIDILDSFGVATEIEVVSAHRTPRRMVEYAETARGRGLKVIIAGAGGGGPPTRNDRQLHYIARDRCSDQHPGP